VPGSSWQGINSGGRKSSESSGVAGKLWWDAILEKPGEYFLTIGGGRTLCNGLNLLC